MTINKLKRQGAEKPLFIAGFLLDLIVRPLPLMACLLFIEVELPFLFLS
jgi:hypothetical protein